MRKLLIFLAAAAILAVVILALAAGYALYNLNSIVARNQARILRLASQAAGRQVQVEQVTAHAGWGVWIEITGLKIADDPRFAQVPFLQAPEATIDVEFLPLLHGAAKVGALTLTNPTIRILRAANGDLNVDSIGQTPGAAPSSSALPALLIKSLEIKDGTLSYGDAEGKTPPAEIRQLDLTLDNFGFTRPFKIDLKCALIGERQNFAIQGTAGPLAHKGVIDAGSIPLELKVQAGPLVVDQLKTLPEIGSSVPADLSMPDPVSIDATFKGHIDSIAFDANSDLTAARTGYANDFVKPAGLKTVVQASGRITSGDFALDSVHLQIADLDLVATKISIPDNGPVQALIDTNRFDLGQIAPTLPALQAHRVGGKGEAHGTFVFQGVPFSGDGTINLAQASFGAPTPVVSNLNATVVFKQNIFTIGPSNFSLRSAHIALQGQVDSISPLHATYQIDTDALKPGELVSGRPPGEVLNKVHVTGTAKGDLNAPQIDTRVTSPSGRLNGAAYSNLDLTASYGSNRVVANPLKIAVCSGNIVATATFVTSPKTRFDVVTKMNGIDVQQGLDALDPGVPHRLRGRLNGDVAVTGAGSDWKTIRPSLVGNGRLVLTNGKVAGLNIVSAAINQIASAPGVSQLVNATFRSNHQGMLADPDTELRDARMTFVLGQERITTHDLTVKSADYGMAGDGWVDMDNNISMVIDIQLTFGLSVTIPVYVRGRVPYVIVVPDIPKLAERIAMGAINTPGRVIRGGINSLKNLLP
ncbi:MAG TPA: AsmA-like C-terminal region-containing protein [Candidatus Binataceae bacterium]|nr:AsmA-like C-terminal region-containing protein [Candidatus Binataceae bacterium]